VTGQRVQRRLAAILAADVVGYSALMQRAEEATYAEFERLSRRGYSVPAIPLTSFRRSQLIFEMRYEEAYRCFQRS
jgi:hypothetical protein